MNDQNRRGTFVSLMLLLFLLVVPSVFAQEDPVPPAEEVGPDLDYVDALWVANTDRVLKVDIETATVLLEIVDGLEARVLSLDEQRGLLWVYGQNTLRSFSFGGEALSSTPVDIAPYLPEDDTGDIDDAHIALCVDSSTGLVRLAVHHVLFQFDHEGQMTGAYELEDTVRAMSTDATQAILWVATKTQLLAIDEAGAEVQKIDLGKKANILSLEVDLQSGNLWVVLKNNLIILDPLGNPIRRERWRNLSQLALDGQGGAWIAQIRQVTLIDDKGESLVEFPLPPDEDGTIGSLVCNHADLSAWFATQATLYRVDTDGIMTHALEVDGEIVRDLKLAVYTDLIPPAIQFEEPSEGDLLNTNTPVLELLYSDIGVGVDPSTLVIQSNGSSLSVTCDSTGNSASCLPGEALAEGPVILSATVEDFVGNLSEAAEVNIEIDTISPSLEIVAPAAGANLNSTDVSIELAYADAGSGVNPETLNVEVNGNPTTCSKDESSATCTPDNPLTEGSYTVTASIQDLAGNPSTATPVTVLVDITGPEIQFVSPAEGAYLSTATPEIELTYSDAGSGINVESLVVEIDGSATTCSANVTGATCTPDSPLSEGPSSVTARISDLAGNSSSPDPLSFSLDVTGPIIGIVQPQAGAILGPVGVEVAVVYADSGAGIDPGTLLVTIDGVPISCVPGGTGAVCVSAAPLSEGGHTAAAGIHDLAGNPGLPAQVSFQIDATPPNIAITSPSDGEILSVGAVEILVAYADSRSGVATDSLIVTVNGSPVACSADASGGTCVAAILDEGIDVISATIQDLVGNLTAPVQISVQVDTVPPLISIVAPPDGSTVTNDSPLIEITYSDSGSGVSPETLSVVVSGTPVTGCVTSETGAQCDPGSLADGDFTVSANVSDLAGNPATPSQISFAVDTTGGLPVIEAPPLDHTAATTMYAATEFLYSGPDPIQTGVTPGTIEPRQGAVVRGRVLDRGGNVLPGVTISVLNHPEFGQTLSRADGVFDMAVNGGGFLTVNYQKHGYLPAQRQVDVPWQNYAHMPDVVLIRLDEQVTTINLTAGTMQVAQGSVETDIDGTRQATILFPQGTSAEMLMPDGSTQPLVSINVRATEYTVGDNGPEAMPAELPPTTGYTYAVELAVDEAIAAGAKQVTFAQPVYFYVENFIGFPAGISVPVGYYDYDKAAWVPSNDGKVIRILGAGTGLADLDVDGSDTPADAAALGALGITEEERTQLAALYVPGQSLWRVPITHFSPYDCNWPVVPQAGSEDPRQPEPRTDASEDDPTPECGSIIECENQVLGEVAEITGTPFTLNYRSSRTIASDSHQLKIPLSVGAVPSILKRILLEIRVAGREFRGVFAAEPNQIHDFVWDGIDVYGRTLQGRQPVFIRIGYVYDGFFALPPGSAQSFGYPSGVYIPGDISARREAIRWQNQNAYIGGWDARSQGFGGWTLSAQHFYDPVAKTLHLGDGTRRSVSELDHIVTRFAGQATGGWRGDGGLATEARLHQPNATAMSPDGSLYIADTYNQVIRRVDPNGIITPVAGTHWAGFSGDGGLATEAQLWDPSDIVIGPDNSLYIADSRNYRIRRVDPNGIITTVAGNGSSDFNEDGNLATEGGLTSFAKIAVGPDGSLYIPGDCRIRRVDPSGVIATVAGQGCISSQYEGEGGPAIEASIGIPKDIAVGPDGSIYFSFGRLVLRVDPYGIITTIAAGGVSGGYSGDGLPATEVDIGLPQGIDVAADGTLFIAAQSIQRILQVNSAGIVTTAAGTGVHEHSGDDGLALAASFFDPNDVSVGPDGSLYIIADGYWYPMVRRVASPFAGYTAADILIASGDGSEYYHFDPTGKHLGTFNTLTGAPLYQLGYDSGGLLVTVEDADGNITTVERDDSGNPLAITSPDGQSTTLALDPNGYLTGITNPAGETVASTYTDTGLLTSFTDANGNASQITYDVDGRLVEDENAAGGSWSLSRTETDTSYTVTKTSALNRVTTYLVEDLLTRNKRRLTTDPSGFSTETVIAPNGTTTVTLPDGTITTTRGGPDPRFNMQAPIPASMSITTPVGLSLSATQERSVTLADPNDLLSLESQTDTVTINGQTFVSVFDSAASIITSTSATGREAVTTVDTVGRPVSIAIPGIEPVVIAYDTRGRLSAITQGAGTDVRNYASAYNTEGYLASITDPLGRVTSYEYDAVGRITREVFPDGRASAYAYDTNGNLTSVTPPSRPAHLFTYTPVNLTEEYTAPTIGLDSTTTYTYNLDKQLTRVTRPDGQTLDLGYDTGGRLNSITIPRGEITYAYDAANGKLATITTPDGSSLSFAYDGKLPLGSTWSGPVTGSVINTFNNDFRVVSRTVNGTSAVDFEYDTDGLLTRAGSLDLTYDADNGLIADTTLGSLTAEFGYNSFAEIGNYSAAFGGVVLFETQYNRDKLSRITEKVENVDGITQTIGYAYDTAGRLTEVTENGALVAQYRYDENGNRLSHTTPLGGATGVYDDQDRMISYGTNSYAYTANGELLSKTENTTSATTSYSYDLVGNLMNVALPNGTRIDYLIDGQNRRIGKSVNGVLVQAFLYKDQLNPVAELDGSGNLVSRFIYATKSNVPDYFEKEGITYRIISDHLGSPRLVIDVATGVVVAQMGYDEFGKVVLDTNPGFQPFGFAGGLYDQHTRLTRFGFRDYDADSGRWTAKDPILFAGGDGNLFGYVANDPVNYSDPLGTLIPKPKFDFPGYEPESKSPPTILPDCGEPEVEDPPLPETPPDEYVCDCEEFCEGDPVCRAICEKACSVEAPEVDPFQPILIPNVIGDGPLWIPPITIPVGIPPLIIP